MEMSERKNVWKKGLEIVSELDKKHPTDSRHLSVLSHPQYVAEFQNDINIRNNVIQHKALIDEWTRSVAKRMNMPPKEKEALMTLILKSHGEVPFFGFQHGKGYEIPAKATNGFVKTVGSKMHALTILRDFQLLWERAIFNEADKTYAKCKKENGLKKMKHPEHLSFHAAHTYFKILAQTIELLEEKNRSTNSEGSDSA